MFGLLEPWKNLLNFQTSAYSYEKSYTKYTVLAILNTGLIWDILNKLFFSMFKKHMWVIPSAEAMKGLNLKLLMLGVL